MGLLRREDSRGDAAFPQPDEEPTADNGDVGEALDGSKVVKEVWRNFRVPNGHQS